MAINGFDPDLRDLLANHKSNLQNNDLYKVYVDVFLKLGKSYVPELTRFLLSKGISPFKYLKSTIPRYCFCGIDQNFVSVLKLKEGITDIEDYAFKDCATLSKVVLPSTLQHLGREAFMGCNNLEVVYINSSLVSFGYGIFNSCPKLTDVYVPWSQGSYDDDDTLQSFDLKDNVTMHYNS